MNQDSQPEIEGLIKELARLGRKRSETWEQPYAEKRGIVVEPALLRRAATALGLLDRHVSPAVARLVIAARVVAYEDQSQDALKELDDAAEAFAGRVAWDDEPDQAASALLSLKEGGGLTSCTDSAASVASQPDCSTTQSFAGLREFFEEVRDYFWVDDRSYFDYEDFQSLAERVGVIVKVPYSQARHGPRGQEEFGIEDGDDWYETAPHLSSEVPPIGAAGEAEAALQQRMSPNPPPPHPIGNGNE